MTATVTPTIETERLTLRQARIEDFEIHNEFYSSERSHFVGGPRDRLENWFTFLALPGHWVVRGYGYWMVDERSSGRLIGAVGIIKHDGWPAPELGWQLFSGQGNGYAYEAATAARNWSATQGIKELISLISPDNARSISLAQRLGASKVGEGDSPFGPIAVWLHPKVGT
ncbi:MAG: GNAT family N-acetyltransferase [Paracoccus sp. (in: a-proteobacteria)]|nr:GNAT family N-acetyltransferase [Paracoccus sp. (in: a-proteobacteria)]